MTAAAAAGVRGAAAPADAIAAYHELLAGTAGEQLAADTQGAMEAGLARRGLVFGTRTLCTVLRPRLLTERQYRALATRVARLSRALARAHAAAVEDPALRAQFRLADWEEALLRDGPRAPISSPTARLDAFVVDTEGDGGTFALTEVNGETPAGAGYNDALAEVFVGLPALRAFARQWHVFPLPARHGITEAILGAWRRWTAATGRAAGSLPRIAILDWDDVPTRAEFLLFQEHFASMGIEAVIADPRACEYRRDAAGSGALYLEGGAVDVIYKRVLLSELVERAGVENDVLRAWRDSAVCMVNPPDGKILHKKASLAVLGDERNAHLFDATDRAVIAECVPWTRVVEERQTEHGGRTVDLVAHVTANRERFVLKPNDEYGGTGIVLGWTVDDAEWAGAVRRALAEPYVVQERVAIPFEAYPSMEQGGVHLLDRMIDTAPYVTDGQVVDGLLTRLSTADLLNVTAGGGSQVPNFIVAPR
jgi:hypothetical protein